MNDIKQEHFALSDNDLLLKIKMDDDQSAFVILMDRYKKKVKGLAYNLLYNAESAEDAMQDVFCTVWKNRKSWDINGTARFSTWLYRVTINRCVDIKRKMRPQVDINDYDLAHDEKGAELKMSQNQMATTLQDLLNELPANQALALRLYYFEDKTIPEISAQIKKSEVSVRSMIKRGKGGLREYKEYLKTF